MYETARASLQGIIQDLMEKNPGATEEQLRKLFLERVASGASPSEMLQEMAEEVLGQLMEDLKWEGRVPRTHRLQ